MKKAASAGVLAALILGGGCATPYSEAPIATNFATTHQKKLQAGAHWQAIADDLAKTISAKASGLGDIYLAPSGNSAFDRAFHELMLTALVNQGSSVVKSPSAARATVNIDAQTVAFSANRPQYDFAGAPTALAAGAWALHGVSRSHSAATTAAAGVTAGLLLIDALHWFRSEFATGATPQSEMFVTVTVSDNARYLARTSNVYYLADSDATLYRGMPSGKTLPVKGQ